MSPEDVERFNARLFEIQAEHEASERADAETTDPTAGERVEDLAHSLLAETTERIHAAARREKASAAHSEERCAYCRHHSEEECASDVGDVEALTDALYRVMVADHFGDREPHPAYLAYDSDQRRTAARIVRSLLPALDAVRRTAGSDALTDAAADWWARGDVTDKFGPWSWLRDRAARIARESG